MLTCHNHYFAFDSWTVGIWCNFLEDWDVFEIALVSNWSYKLLTQRCESSLRNCSHCDFLRRLNIVTAEMNKGRRERKAKGKKSSASNQLSKHGGCGELSFCRL
jgi:hypothetical protein